MSAAASRSIRKVVKKKEKVDLAKPLQSQTDNVDVFITNTSDTLRNEILSYIDMYLETVPDEPLSIADRKLLREFKKLVSELVIRPSPSLNDFNIEQLDALLNFNKTIMNANLESSTIFRRLPPLALNFNKYLQDTPDIEKVIKKIKSLQAENEIIEKLNANVRGNLDKYYKSHEKGKQMLDDLSKVLSKIMENGKFVSMTNDINTMADQIEIKNKTDVDIHTEKLLSSSSMGNI